MKHSNFNIFIMKVHIIWKHWHIIGQNMKLGTVSKFTTQVFKIKDLSTGLTLQVIFYKYKKVASFSFSIFNQKKSKKLLYIVFVVFIVFSPSGLGHTFCP